MTHHLQADCQELGSAVEPYARQSSWVWATFLVCWCFLQNYSSLRWVSYVDCQHICPHLLLSTMFVAPLLPSAGACCLLISYCSALCSKLAAVAVNRWDGWTLVRFIDPVLRTMRTVSVTFKCLCSVLFLFMYLWTFCVIVLALINVAVFENAMDSE